MHAGGARSRGDRRGKIEVYPKRRSLPHDVSDLVLETVEKGPAFGEDIALIEREITVKRDLSCVGRRERARERERERDVLHTNCWCGGFIVY